MDYNTMHKMDLYLKLCEACYRASGGDSRELFDMLRQSRDASVEVAVGFGVKWIDMDALAGTHGYSIPDLAAESGITRVAPFLEYVKFHGNPDMRIPVRGFAALCWTEAGAGMLEDSPMSSLLVRDTSGTLSVLDMIANAQPELRGRAEERARAGGVEITVTFPQSERLRHATSVSSISALST